MAKATDIAPDETPPPSRRRPPTALLVILGAALVWGIACLVSMLRTTGGHLSMPLDDAYIFFQYARRTVAGTPFVYADGAGAAAGATSLLTVAVDALGYLAGFRGAAMSVFALLLGSACFAWAGWSAFRLGRRLCPRIAWFPPTLLLTSGPLVWGFLSGMDLPLFAALALAFAADWPSGTEPPSRRFYVLGALLGLARPDAVFLVLPAFALALFTSARGRGWILPLAGTALPFLVQLVATGRPESASMEVKSVLAQPGLTAGDWMVAGVSYLQTALKGILGGGIVEEARSVTANNGAAAGHYVIPFALLFLLLGLAPGAWAETRRRRPGVLLLSFVWLALLLSAQAFTVPRSWHWHRYLMPVYALAFPALAVGVDRTGRWVEAVWEELAPGDGSRSLAAFLTLAALPGAIYFTVAYGRNCSDIYFQHIQLARSLNEGTPVGVRTCLGLHDAGALTYFGDYRILDLEGLTTPEFRDAARLGSAGIWERMERIPPERRPDVLAVYASWFDPVFLRPHRLVHRQRLFRPTIAAGNPLDVYVTDWSLAGRGDLPRSSGVTTRIRGLTLLADVDVADDRSEAEADYAYRILDGAYENLLLALPSEGGEMVMDGGRMISGGESFTVRGAAPSRELVVVVRTHAPFRLRVETNAGPAGIWTEGGEADGWRESLFRIPASAVTSETVRLGLRSDDPHHSAYGSFHYWVYRP